MGTIRTRLARSYEGVARDCDESHDGSRTSGLKGLDDLPDELLAAIAQSLDCVDNYSTMRRVSRRWRTIVSDRTLLGPPLCMKTHHATEAISEKKKKTQLYAHSPMCPRHRLACADAIRAGAGSDTLRGLKSMGHKFNGDAVMAAILADDVPSLAVLTTSKGCEIEREHYNAAAQYGRINVLARFLAAKGATWRNSEVPKVAARHGHLDCLKLAHRSGIKWDAKVAMAAARGGHLNCLAYAHEYGCPWDASALYAKARSHGHKACCDYIARHTTKRLPNEPRDTILAMFAVLVMVSIFVGVVVLVIAVVVRHGSKTSE
ncbi:ankyrin repeat protein [Pandoravirus inopinatum]|uniref:Ankyrin repeat protein n=1 Tax=Pandoravirus inopinatum TaxID=1605721 RepID=A0A0B5J1J5_9VIRU|nr:ankyrin repeat protein [Pandoravirus inopinatum]AJF97379.1 ankyrin repeat protein [Pandoravirus inopinatum]